jgi:hypothetical protein
MIFYLLQLASHPVTVVGRLVIKKERNSYIQRETIYKTLQKIQNPQNGKQNKQGKEKVYKKDKFKIHKTIN